MIFEVKMESQMQELLLNFDCILLSVEIFFIKL